MRHWLNIVGNYTAIKFYISIILCKKNTRFLCPILGANSSLPLGLVGRYGSYIWKQDLNRIVV